MINGFSLDSYWVRDAWYPVCPIGLISKTPLRRTLMSIPLVIYRTESGNLAALLDSCPHRQAPLSKGRVQGECIQCPFHGWTFDAKGSCTNTPAIPKQQAQPRYKLPSFPIRESSGLAWVFLGEAFPKTDDNPPALLCSDKNPALIHYHYTFTVETDIVSALENGLDFTHAGFVHAKTFRSMPSQSIQVDIRESKTFVEFNFVGEPKPKGLLFKLLDTSNSPFTHFDRFYPPSMIETVYSYGNKIGLQFREVMTPIKSDCTEVFGCLLARPHPLIPKFFASWALHSQGNKIITEDQEILRMVHQNRHSFDKIAKPGVIKSDLYRRYIESRLEQRTTTFAAQKVRSIEVLI